MNEEFNKLTNYLIENHYFHEIHVHEDNYQVIVRDGEGRYLWDAVCNPISYGNKQGLLEVAGSIVHSTHDSVEGYLTAEEIISRLQ